MGENTAEGGETARRFADFYGFCLFVGTTLGLAAALHAFSTLSHFFFERNRPATFTHPLYSLLGDWVMWKDMLTGRIRF